MTRLLVICEGKTELEFIKTCVAPHLQTFAVWTTVQSVGKRINVDRLVAHVRREHLRFTHVTTLVDYYAFHRKGARTRAQLEDAIAEAARHALGAGYDAQRIIPYVQMHEFEALLFSDVTRFTLEESWSDQQRQALAAIRRGFPTPEDINDSPQTAPSKRLGRVLPGYESRKSLYGPLIAEDIGLTVIRRKCPGFDAWLRRLEALGNPGAGAG